MSDEQQPRWKMNEETRQRVIEWLKDISLSEDHPFRDMAIETLTVLGEHE